MFHLSHLKHEKEAFNTAKLEILFITQVGTYALHIMMIGFAFISTRSSHSFFYSIGYVKWGRMHVHSWVGISNLAEYVTDKFK